MQIVEYKKKQKTQVNKEHSADLMKKMRKEYDRLEKGMFEFTDAKGGWIEFTERTFPDQAPMVIRLTHGEICELPMGIIKRINNTKTKVRKFATNLGTDVNSLRGIPSTYEVTSRIKFTPLSVI